MSCKDNKNASFYSKDFYIKIRIFADHASVREAANNRVKVKISIYRTLKYEKRPDTALFSKRIAILAADKTLLP